MANFRGLSTADGKEKGKGRSESMGPPRSITPGMLYSTLLFLIFSSLSLARCESVLPEAPVSMDFLNSIVRSSHGANPPAT